MAVDYKLALSNAIWAAFAANAGVTAAFKSVNQINEATDGPMRQRIMERVASDFPSLTVEIVGGDEQTTKTPHFGLTGTVTVCDAIIPISVIARIRMKFATDKLSDHTSPDTYVRQAIHQGYPKLGLSYVRDFNIREKRTPPVEGEGISVIELTLTVNMRLHLSQLRD